MMAEVKVEVHTRKGMGPEWIPRFFPFIYDDLPEGTTKQEIMDMAKRDVNELLTKSEDFIFYGHNWIIVDYHWP